jgi:hypothetical protein
MEGENEAIRKTKLMAVEMQEFTQMCGECSKNI